MRASSKVDYIQGLRALAVILVLIFHVDPMWLPSGYLGVDVFFAISGYVITRLIVGQLQRDEFSLKDFYVSRAIRLLPNLFITIALTLLVFSFIYGPTDLVALSKSSLAASFSISNLYFFNEAGYFSEASKYKPLLHTWSLGVEEQFYLVWPFFLIFLTKAIKFKVRFIIFIALVLSSVSVAVAAKNSDLAFYLSPFRAHEFVFGSLFFYWQKTRVLSSFVLRAMPLWGLVVLFILIVLSFSTFPVGAAQALAQIFSVLIAGTACMLADQAKSQGFIESKFNLLEYKPFLWLGAISYSVYLVHWPVMILAQKFISGSSLITATFNFFILFVCIVFGFMLHKFAEITCQRKSVNLIWFLQKRLYRLALLSCFCIVLSLHFMNRYHNDNQGLTGVIIKNELRNIINDRGNNINCEFNLKHFEDTYLTEIQTCSERKGKNVLIVGDSLSIAQRYALSDYDAELNITRIFLNGCPPYFGGKAEQIKKMQKYLKACRNEENFIWNTALANVMSNLEYSFILISGNWHTKLLTLQNHKESFDSLNLIRSKVLLIGLQPFYLESMTRILENGDVFNEDSNDVSTFLSEKQVGSQLHYNDALKSLSANFPNINYFDIYSVFCPDYCLALDKNNNALYLDRSHLTTFGAIFLSKDKNYREIIDSVRL